MDMNFGIGQPEQPKKAQPAYQEDTSLIDWGTETQGFVDYINNKPARSSIESHPMEDISTLPIPKATRAVMSGNKYFDVAISPPEDFQDQAITWDDHQYRSSTGEILEDIKVSEN